MNAITLEPRLNEFQKVHLREILARKSKSICRKAGLICRGTGEPKPENEPYAEFWCRTGRAKLVERWNGTQAEFTGILQFSVYPACPDNNQGVEEMADRIARAFSNRDWITEEAWVATHQMAWKWLPVSETRRTVLIIDGSFTYSVWLNQSGEPALN